MPQPMHDGQLSPTVETVRALLRSEFPMLGDRPVHRLASHGTANAIFRVGEHLVARLALQPADPHDHLAVVRAEASRAERFALVCPVSAPRLVGVGQPAGGYPMPWTLQTWVPGDVLTPTNAAGSHRVASDVVAVLAALRDAPVQGEGFRGYGRGYLLRQFQPWVAECLQRSVGMFDTAAVAEVWEELRDEPPPSELVLSHTDFIPGNLLLNGDRLVGVIDTGDCSPADPALDLAIVWQAFDESARVSILRELGADEAERRRARAWALVQAVGLVWYYVDSNPAMADLGRTTIRRILSAR